MAEGEPTGAHPDQEGATPEITAAPDRPDRTPEQQRGKELARDHLTPERSRLLAFATDKGREKGILNPDHTLEPADLDEVGQQLESATPDKLPSREVGRVMDDSRDDFWQNFEQDGEKITDFKEQNKIWNERTRGILERLINENDDSGQPTEKAQTAREALTVLGFDENETFTKTGNTDELHTGVDQFRKNYLKETSDIHKFVEKLAEGCTQQDNPNAIDIDKLQSRIQAVNSLLGSFGQEKDGIDRLAKDYAMSYGLLKQENETKKVIAQETRPHLTTELTGEQKNVYKTLAQKQEQIEEADANPAEQPEEEVVVDLGAELEKINDLEIKQTELEKLLDERNITQEQFNEKHIRLLVEQQSSMLKTLKKIGFTDLEANKAFIKDLKLQYQMIRDYDFNGSKLNPTYTLPTTVHDGQTISALMVVYSFPEGTSSDVATRVRSDIDAKIEAARQAAEDKKEDEPNAPKPSADSAAPDTDGGTQEPEENGNTGASESADQHKDETEHDNGQADHDTTGEQHPDDETTPATPAPTGSENDGNESAKPDDPPTDETPEQANHDADATPANPPKKEEPADKKSNKGWIRRWFQRRP